jgi:hypothetical protein
MAERDTAKKRSREADAEIGTQQAHNGGQRSYLINHTGLPSVPELVRISWGLIVSEGREQKAGVLKKLTWPPPGTMSLGSLRSCVGEGVARASARASRA